MRVMLTAAGLLTCSNVFMTFAWYAHLKDLRGQAWYVAALVSWSNALFEYMLDSSHSCRCRPPVRSARGQLSRRAAGL